MRYQTFRDDIYFVTFHVYRLEEGEDDTELEKDFQEKEWTMGKVEDCFAAWVDDPTGNRASDLVVVFRMGESLNPMGKLVRTIAHEAVHLAVRVFEPRRVSLNLINDDDEHLAYYMGWLAWNLMEALGFGHLGLEVDPASPNPASRSSKTSGTVRKSSTLKTRKRNRA